MHRIDPELYQKTLEQLSLQIVCLDEVRACCVREVAQDGQVDIKLFAEAEDQQTESQYLAYITYRLRGERDNEMLLEVEAKYRLVFDASQPIPDGFFEVFRDLNLRITTMPYFRELIASITGRMEIPTLTLPYAIYAASQQQDEKQEIPKPMEDKAIRRRRPQVRKTSQSN